MFKKDAYGHLCETFSDEMSPRVLIQVRRSPKAASPQLGEVDFIPDAVENAELAGAQSPGFRSACKLTSGKSLVSGSSHTVWVLMTQDPWRSYWLLSWKRM